MTTVRKRHLANQLSALRSRAGLSVEVVSARVGVSKSTIQRIERADFLPKEQVMRRMLDLYGADSDQVGALLEMRQQAKQLGWWVHYKDILKGPYVELEEQATRIRCVEPLVVPGLLQTEEYAAASLAGMRGAAADNARRVELRVMRRTKYNTRPDPAELHVIIDEGILHREVGSREIMRDQVGYLRKMADRPHITIQVIPYAAGAHAGISGSFAILSFPDPGFPDVAYVETRVGDLYPEGKPTLDTVEDAWERLTKVALTPEQSARMLTDILEEWI
jgi:transcriptional regulator with XRE-family HTH domain